MIRPFIATSVAVAYIWACAYLYQILGVSVLNHEWWGFPLITTLLTGGAALLVVVLLELIQWAR